MIKEAKLNTLHMFDDENRNDKDYLLWNKIARYMDGEMAFVTDSSMEPGKYIFLGLINDKKNKEVHYLMEQDSMVGVYINDREGFDKVWDRGEYDKDGVFYLEGKYVILT